MKLVDWQSSLLLISYCRGIQDSKGMSAVEYSSAVKGARNMYTCTTDFNIRCQMADNRSSGAQRCLGSVSQKTWSNIASSWIKVRVGKQENRGNMVNEY